MQWIELFVNLIRDGFPQQISLEFLLPHAGKEREQLMKEVDALVTYHRQLKVAHHERLRRRYMKGETRETDEDTTFVAGVMDNLNLSKMGNDVDDLAAEDSEDEEQDLADSDKEDEFEDAQEVQIPGTHDGRQSEKKRKNRKAIEPPVLVHIPKLTEVFVEMIRPSLLKAREQAKRG